MTWIESHQTLRDHPKTKRFARLLGANRFEAIGVLHCLWWWTLDYAEDGDLSRFSDEDIADGIDWPNDPTVLVSALTQAGFIEDERLVHDWYEYAGRYIERRKANAERMRKARAAGSDTSESQRAGDVQRTSSARTGATNQPERTVPTGPTGEDQPARVREGSPPSPEFSPPLTEVVAILDAARIPVYPTAADDVAVASCRAPAATIAAAYEAASSGKWGDDFIRDNLNLAAVCKRLGGFESARRAGFGRANGQTAHGNLTEDQQREKYREEFEGLDQRGAEFLERQRKQTKETIQHARSNRDNGADGDSAGESQIRRENADEGTPAPASMRSPGRS